MARIRSATQADADAIAHVHVQSWRTTYAGVVPDEYLRSLDQAERAQLWREAMASDIEVLVAEIDQRIMGFISGGPVREPVANCDAELYAIYLLECAQRSGLGTGLLLHLAGTLRRRGFKSMSVWVLDQNSSKQFYSKLGAGYVASKYIEIGGALLTELAYAWPDLAAITSPS
jgi:L-amino acid N-acyltransferase YncA